jgi:hypothetical protein
VGALTNKELVEQQLLYNISLSTPTGAICLTDVYKKDMLQTFCTNLQYFIKKAKFAIEKSRRPRGGIEL